MVCGGIPKTTTEIIRQHVFVTIAGTCLNRICTFLENNNSNSNNNDNSYNYNTESLQKFHRIEKKPTTIRVRIRIRRKASNLS